MREREENDLSSRSDIFKFVKTGMLGSYECDLAVEREREGGGREIFWSVPPNISGTRSPLNRANSRLYFRPDMI